MAERIQLSRAKGWRMPPNTVKVDRSTKWGNPFRGDQSEVVARYRSFVKSPNPRGHAELTAFSALVHDMHEIRGKNLACWCKPGTPCHADVLLELANTPERAAPGSEEGGK